MTTLDLNDREVMALLLLLKLGMDVYSGEEAEAGIAALHGASYAAIESVILKVSEAGERSAAMAHEGEA